MGALCETTGRAPHPCVIICVSTDLLAQVLLLVINESILATHFFIISDE